MKKIVIIFLFFSTISTLSFSQISKLEKDALIDLYQATNGSSWNTTWDLNGEVHTWFGITIENNKVTKIDLRINNLDGFIPPTIGNLTSLQELNLAFNKIGGIIPSEITAIKSLRSIKLFINQIEGQIPSNIGELHNLKELA
jgi:Leucine-rich repeat (LRR) protein